MLAHFLRRMSSLFVFSTALAFSWFGQLPPHGEFERDALGFLLLSIVALVVGLRAHRSTLGRAAGGDVLHLGSALSAFTALWLLLLGVLSMQFLGMPQTAWGGRNVLVLFWLLGTLVAMFLGALAAKECRVSASPAAGNERAPAWTLVAWGQVWAAVFNALVAWIQVVPLPQLQAWVPAPVVSGRGYGALQQPNLTATLLVIGIASASVLSRLQPLRTWRTHLLWAVVVLLGSGVAVTGSRVGLLLLIVWSVGLVLARFLQRGHPLAGRRTALPVWLPAMGFVLALLSVALLGVDFASSLARSGAMSNGRLLIFSNAWEMGRAFPLFGAGFGQFSYWHVELPYQPKMPGYLTHAHNLVLQFWAELGAVGVVWLSLAGAVLTRPLWPLLRGQRLVLSTGQGWAFAILVFLLLHSMTEMPLWSAPFLLLFGFAAGLWLAPNAMAIAEDPSARRGLPMPALVKYGVLVGMIGIALSAWVYLDYLKVSALYEGTRWASTDPDRVARRADTSVFFHPTAEFAAANSATVSQQTAQAYGKTLPYVWRYVTDPRMFEWQLRTSAWSNNRTEFEHHAQRFAQLYPEQYAAFRASASMEKYERPWTDFPVVWP